MGMKGNSFRGLRSRVVFLVLVLPGPLVLGGCFGAAVGTALGLLGGGEGSSGGTVEPAVPSPKLIADGPFVLLKQGDPRAVVLGDFLPDEDPSGRNLDAAVSFEGQSLVAFLRGDGSGRLAWEQDVSGSRALAIASRPDKKK